jgi:hypothetical protein
MKLLALISLAALCHAKGAFRQVESVTQNSLAAQGWMVSSHTLLESQEITLQIGLVYQGMDQLINRLLAVSKPKTKDYGKWLKKSEVQSIVKPTEEANDAVVKWLASEGITKLSSDGTWVTFKANVSTVNTVLNANFQRFEREGVQKIRTLSYSVPEDVLKHVDLVHPTTFFGKTEALNPINFPEKLRKRDIVEAEEPPPASSASLSASASAAASTVAPAPPKAASPPPPAKAPIAPPASPPAAPSVNFTPLANSQLPPPKAPTPRVPEPAPAMGDFAPPAKGSAVPIHPPFRTTAAGRPPLPTPKAPSLPPSSPAGPVVIIVPKGGSPPPVQPLGAPKVVPRPRPTKPAPPKPYFKVDAECVEGLTPSCIRQMYNIGNYTAKADSGSVIAFSSFLNQSANYVDLSVYQKAFSLPIQNWTKVFITEEAKTANSQNPADALSAAGEANLDIQNMMAIAHGLPMIEFLTGGKPPFIPDLEMKSDAQNTNEPYVPYYQALLEMEDGDLPQVISNSYGEPEHTVPPRYAQRTCFMIAQLTVRGVTVFESSGDTGIGSYCRANDGSKKPIFLAEFPASCPWLTAVGGTESVSPEIAWRDSSGGFSNYFGRPAFQHDAVDTYFNEHFPTHLKTDWASYFNSKGRGFPDISAHSLYPEFRVSLVPRHCDDEFN